MKLLLLSICLFIVFSSSLIAQDSTWRYTNPHMYPLGLKSIHSVDGGDYFIHGSLELFKLYSDTMVEHVLKSPEEGYLFLNSTTIINDSTFFVNIINSYFTTNNGESYSVSSEQLSLSKVVFFDEKNAIAVGRDLNLETKLYRSNDSGMNWEEIFDYQGYQYLYRAKSQDSIIVLSKDVFYYTFDGGGTWEEGAIWTESSTISKIYIVDDKIILKTFNSLYFSDDFGKSFYHIKTFEKSMNVANEINLEFTFFDDKKWACSKFDKLYITEDAGSNWDEYEFDYSYDRSLEHIRYDDQGNLFINGFPRRFIDLENLKIDPLVNPKIIAPEKLINFRDSIYVLFNYSINTTIRNMSVSEDRGYNWRLHETFDWHQDNFLIDFFLLESGLAYYLNEDHLYKSVFPFDEWDELSAIQSNFWSRLFFYNEEEGFVISNDLIFHTINGGLSFSSSGVENEFIVSEMFQDEENALCAWILGRRLDDNNVYIYKICEGAIVEEFSTEFSNYDLINYLFYPDGLFLGTKNGNYNFDFSSGELNEICSYGNRQVIGYISADSIFVVNHQSDFDDMFLVNLDCDILYELPFKYPDSPKKLRGAKYHFSSSKEGFMITSTGSMLKLTDNFREDLLIGTKEEKPIPPKVESLYLYPNPAYDRVYINKPITNPRIVLYDLNGRMMKQSESQEMEIGEMGMGMYFYVIMDGGEYVGSGKLVVVR